LSQFKEDTGGPSVPVREINLIAYLPLVQPTKNLRPDLDLNLQAVAGHQPVRPSRHCGSENTYNYHATHHDRTVNLWLQLLQLVSID